MRKQSAEMSIIPNSEGKKKKPVKLNASQHPISFMSITNGKGKKKQIYLEKKREEKHKKAEFHLKMEDLHP